jgi:shikimate kinase
MGSGKSTVGRALARRLGREFVDLDAKIEARARQPIREIFVEDGEARFRDLESECLADIAGQPGLVVALGGGAIWREENWKLIRASGMSIYLKVEPKTILARLGEAGDRPLLLGFDGETRLPRIRRMLRARRPLYERADLTVSNETTPEEAVDRIARELQRLWKSSM